jgi:hypothetical protein
MRASFALLAVAIAVPLVLAAEPSKEDAARTWMENNVRINELQFIGTHNSFHIEIPRPVMGRLLELDPVQASQMDMPTHVSLTEQLDMGLRQLEIDIYDDPDGGRFANPLGEQWAMQADAQMGRKRPPFDPEGRLLKPGFKTLHSPDVDYLSTCLVYRECLEEVRRWSDANPGHLPVFINGNAKEPGRTPPPWGASPARPFDQSAFVRLDAEVVSVFGRERLISPAMVAGSHGSVLDGSRQGGWPILAAARGKIVMVIDGSASQAQRYRDANGARAVFFTEGGDPRGANAGYTSVIDSRRPPQPISGLVAAGFMVRTLSDYLTVEPRTGDTSRRDTALASGAQLVSTDYYRPDPRFAAAYVVDPFAPGRWVRCNPVNAPAGCRSEWLR